MINKDGGGFVALIGKFALQLRVKTHFSQRHLFNRDAFSWFGCDEDLVGSLASLPH